MTSLSLGLLDSKGGMDKEGISTVSIPEAAERVKLWA